MTDTLVADDDGTIQFEGEQLERVQKAERARHAQIKAVWDDIPSESQSIFTYIHEKIMDGKFDAPNPHNHIKYLNDTRNTWIRQLRLRVGSEDNDA